MLKKLHFYISLIPILSLTQSFSSGLKSAARKLTELPAQQLKCFWATGKVRQLLFKPVNLLWSQLGASTLLLIFVFPGFGDFSCILKRQNNRRVSSFGPVDLSRPSREVGHLAGVHRHWDMVLVLVCVMAAADTSWELLYSNPACVFFFGEPSRRMKERTRGIPQKSCWALAKWLLFTGKVVLQWRKQVPDDGDAPRTPQKLLPSAATHVGHISVVNREAKDPAGGTPLEPEQAYARSACIHS